MNGSSSEGQRRALSHLVHSESQLETREVGQQMMTRLARGTPPSCSCPPCSSVHSSAMPCSVFLHQAQLT